MQTNRQHLNSYIFCRRCWSLPGWQGQLCPVNSSRCLSFPISISQFRVFWSSFLLQFCLELAIAFGYPSPPREQSLSSENWWISHHQSLCSLLRMHLSGIDVLIQIFCTGWTLSEDGKIDGSGPTARRRTLAWWALQQHMHICKTYLHVYSHKSSICVPTDQQHVRVAYLPHSNPDCNREWVGFVRLCSPSTGEILATSRNEGKHQMLQVRAGQPNKLCHCDCHQCWSRLHQTWWDMSLMSHPQTPAQLADPVNAHKSLVTGFSWPPVIRHGSDSYVSLPWMAWVTN